VPGETEAADLGWCLTAFPTEPVPNLDGANLDVVVDRDRLAAPLHFRSARPGDRFRPLGASGERLVADVLSESGMTRAMRARLPVVCDVAGVVWVPGCRLADRVKITEDSTQGLCLRIGPVRNSGRPGPSER
jgi:tRNA(Ile)-lysidine synthase